MKKTIVMLCMGLGSGIVLAEPYFGASYSHIRHEEAGLPNFGIPSLILRGGYALNQYFSVEGRAGAGIQNPREDYNISTTTAFSNADMVGDPTFDNITTTTNIYDSAEPELNHLYGIYLLGKYPINKTVNLYGLVGYTDSETIITPRTGDVSITTDIEDGATGETSSSTNTTSGTVGSAQSHSASGLSYGVGISYATAENITLDLEYTSYLAEDEYDLSAINVGMTWAF